MNKITVYNASAGSGKTFTLAAQYIAILLKDNPNMYRHILAVTFTNKATAEMKERILQRLWDLAHLPEYFTTKDNDFYAEIAKLLPELSLEELKRRASTALQSLTHDYDHFYVQTIDAFFQSLLTNLAHEMGLAAGFKVDLDDKEAIRKGVERLMSKIDNNKELKEWVLNYIKERISDNQRWDITAEVTTLANEIMKEQFMQHEAALNAQLSNSQLLSKYRRELSARRDNASQIIIEAAKTFDASITEQCDNGYATFSRGGQVLQPFISRLMNGDFREPSDSIKNNWLENYEAWLKKADLKKPELVALAQTMNKQLIQVENLRQKGYSMVNSCNLSLRHINPLRLLNAIGQEVNAINNENNRFMLAKTPQLFHQLVEKEDASFVFEKAGILFDEIMIDEFQDTSSLQWKNFKKLLIENQASGNGCLLVGDVKQSIYRFRGGDWSILNHIQEELPNNQPVIRQLSTNFRSTENIIAFNNTFFPVAASVLDNFGGTGHTIQDIYNDVNQNINHKAGGQVRIKLYEKEDSTTNENEEEETIDTSFRQEEDMAQQILQLHAAGTSYNDIAILVRYNSSTSAILSYFSTKHPEIPLISDEAFLLSASPAVQFIIHALRYLNDSSDSIALGYLVYTYQKHILGNTYEWSATTGTDKTLLPESFFDETQQEEWRNMPLYSLCEQLIETFQLNRFQGAAPYLFAFLDQVLGFLEDNASDIAVFLQLWNDSLCKKAVPAGEVDGVRILTIHKSKGLAFPTVFLPYCDWKIERNHINDLLWCQPQEDPYNQLPVLPIPLQSGKTVEASIYAEPYLHEHLQRRIENLNLLYVAFTRAQQNLYIWAEYNDQKKNAKSSKKKTDTEGYSETPVLPKEPTIADLILASLRKIHEKDTDDNGLSYDNELNEWNFSVKTSAVQPRKKQEKTPPNPLEIIPEKVEFLDYYQTKSNVEFMQSNRAKEFLTSTDDEQTDEQTQQSYISQGKLLHRLFAEIRTADDIDTVIKDFEQEGCISYGKETSQLSNFIHKRIVQSEAARWFNGSWQLFNECTILIRDEMGQLHARRPDRVMISDNEAIVVDFKFGKPRPEYNEQVKQYCHLLQQMKTQPVSGYLWYVYTGKIEKVF